MIMRGVAHLHGAFQNSLQIMFVNASSMEQGPYFKLSKKKLLYKDF